MSLQTYVLVLVAISLTLSLWPLLLGVALVGSITFISTISVILGIITVFGPYVFGAWLLYHTICFLTQPGAEVRNKIARDVVKEDRMRTERDRMERVRWHNSQQVRGANNFAKK